MSVRNAAVTLVVGLLSIISTISFSQEYPSKPIRLITGSGGSDVVSRLISPGLAEGLGRPVIVDNRAQVIVRELMMKAPPDGYTIMLAGSSFAIAPFLEKVSYDPVRDFTPVSMVDKAPQVLVVSPTLPVKSVTELIALAKAKPGQLNYSSGSSGGPGHLAMELFKSMVGINIVRVPYKGAAPAITAVVSSEVQAAFATGSSVASNIAAGRLRALGVTSAQPSPLFPGVPALAESGVPAFKLAGTFDAVFVPSRTPASIVRRLHAEIAQTLNHSDVKQRFLEVGIEPISSTPEELAATIKSEMALWGKVIRDLGLRPE